MKLSAEGQAIIKSFEGLRLTAYLPTPDDVPTIGWGHAGNDVHMGMTISEARAHELFLHDVEKFEAGVERLVTVDLKQNQFDALVSFALNLGLGALGNSTLLRLLNAGRADEAAGEFLRWDKQAGKTLAGLTRRRQAEMALFAEGLA